jgi:hypothetical protein
MKGSSAMDISTPPVSALRRRAILAVTSTITIVAAFAIGLSFAASTEILTYGSSEKGSPPFSGSPISGCVPQNPNGPVWVPHRSETDIQTPKA